LQGKFLLSSYPNKRLTEFIKEHGWYHLQTEGTASVAMKGKRKKKIECLTANYPIESNN